MKFETLNGVLTFVLGVLVVLGVIMAVRIISLTHEYRTLQKQAVIYQTIIAQTQGAYNDAVVYNQRYQDPVLAQILRSATKPAGR
jgi:hypothetical protein